MKRVAISGGVRAGHFLFLSGRTSPGGTTERQIERILEDIKGVLEEAGTSMGNVVEATIYLADLDDREEYLNDLWSKYFPADRPARTCVQVALPVGTTVEITVIAILPGEG